MAEQKMKEVLVHRAQVGVKRAEGYEIKPGNGPGGHEVVGDAIVMTIPEKGFQELQRGRRKSYNSLKTRIEAGQLPIGSTGDPQVRVEPTHRPRVVKNATSEQSKGD